MSNAKSPLFEFRDVTKRYGSGDAEVRALDGVNLQINHGDFLSMMGPSGSGKSTCLNLLGCLDEPTDGTVLLDGQDIQSHSLNKKALLRRHRFGFVFQGFNLLARTDALENVELPLVYQRVGQRERRERAMQALDLVGLSDRRHHTAAELSGGQKQRVAIARALVTKPDVLLADEPTGNLDSTCSREIMELLSKLHQAENVAIVLVTHEQAMAEYADRILRFLDGQIESDQPAMKAI
jgi:ABC-type lipoprotein export system ATPase subunit